MYLKKLVKFGNAKLPKTTIIFNMGSSKNCPSRLRGMCKCAKKCYARKPEIIYPAVLPYREKQAEFWLTITANEFCEQIGKIIDRKRIKPTLFRFNEAGDFYTQECITKLNIIAEYLLKNYKIKSYGYTANDELDFSNASFLVKGSENSNGNNGETAIIYKGETMQKGFVRCPGSCKTCTLCSSDKAINIAFNEH